MTAAFSQARARATLISAPWWLLLLLVPAAAALGIQVLHAGALDRQAESSKIVALKADVTSAYAAAGWSSEFVDRGAPVNVRWRAAAAALDVDLRALLNQPVDTTRARTIATATAALVRTLGTTVADHDTNSLVELSAAQQETSVLTRINAYLAELDAGATVIERITTTGIWVVVLAEGGLLVLLLGRFFTGRRRMAVRAALSAAGEASNARFRALVQNSSDLISIAGRDGRVTYLNDATVSFGIGRPEIGVGTGMEFVVEEDRARLGEAMVGLRAEPGGAARARYRARFLDGSIHTLESVARNALDDPAVAGIVVNTRDVTDAVRNEALLGTQQRILTMIASGAPLDDTLRAISTELKTHLPDARCAIQVVGPDTAMWVRGAASREGLACVLMEGRPGDGNGSLCGNVLEQHRELFVAQPARTPTAGHAPCLTVGGQICACWATPLRRDSQGKPTGVLSLYFTSPYDPNAAARQAVAVAGELASLAIERSRFDERIRHQAVHDQLTGLPNRTLLLEHLHRDVARSHRTATLGAVLCVDVTPFESLNDALGHDSGDEVLREVGRRIVATVRAEDTVARLSNGEFAVGCNDIGDEQEAVRLADRLLAAIAAPLWIEKKEVRLTASIGIVVWQSGTVRAASLVRNAGAAMNRAKALGGNRWEIFNADIRRQAIVKWQVAGALRSATERGEFELWYQPVCSLSARAMVAVEALLRWPQANGSILQPASFIELAEETGLISRIGAWALERACTQIVHFETTTGRRLEIAVNASLNQLVDGSLVPAVERALEVSNLDPHRLLVELTESSLLREPAAVTEAVERLQRLGVKIALDDFGTGFSSLSYVKSFPHVDAIKVDRSFVSGQEHPTRIDLAIIRASVALAEAHGGYVIAEGVETVEQLEAVGQLGIDHVQGFLLGRPMPLDDLVSAQAHQPWRDTLAALRGRRGPQLAHLEAA